MSHNNETNQGVIVFENLVEVGEQSENFGHVVSMLTPSAPVNHLNAEGKIKSRTRDFIRQNASDFAARVQS